MGKEKIKNGKLREKIRIEKIDGACSLRSDIESKSPRLELLEGNDSDSKATNDQSVKPDAADRA
jgi:hypothetical protein